jgi:OFA family oxalate/formate antiporter-like MFS transporter
MKNNKNPWVSIIACLVVQLCVGIIYLWSVFRTPIVTAFDWDAGAAKMVSSYMLFAFVFGNLIGGFLNDKKGPKFTCIAGVILFAVGVASTGLLTKKTIGLIYLTYCLMGGLGSGFAYGACISCIQKWLPHRRGFASGLAVSAFGLSTVVFTPVSKWLMTLFTNAEGIVNFRPVFLILGCVFFVLGIVACLFISLPSDEYIKSLNLPAAAVSNVKNYTLGQAMKTVPFWAIFLSIFFINGTWNLATPLIYDLGVERGLTPALATTCVAMTGIPNAAGRLVMATVSDKIGRTATINVLSVMTLVGAILMCFVTGYAYFAVIMLIAFAYGGPSATNAAISTDFFGPKNSGTNYGVIMLALGFSSVFFNWVSNTFLNGAVIPTFIMAAITAIIPMFLMVVVKKYQKTWNQ